MTRPTDAELLLAYLAGELAAPESAALEARLKAEPRLAEQFVALARDEAVLTEWAKLTPSASGTDFQSVLPPTPVSTKRRLRTAALLVFALAASLLLAVGVSVHFWRQPATVPVAGPIAFLEDVQGEVVLVADGTTTPVEKGQTLFRGAELRTVGEGSSAVVRYPDAARLELSADTTARLEDVASKNKGEPDSRRVYVPEGLLTLIVTQTPIVLATPHVEVHSTVGTFMCNIAPAATCIEPEKGSVQVTRSGQASVEVEAGFYAVANAETVSKPRLRPRPVTLAQEVMTDGNAPNPWLVYTPDGRTLISAGNDGVVRFWDVASRQVQRSIKAHAAGIRGLALSPDGLTLVTAGQDHFVHVWNARTGDEKYLLRKYNKEIECVAFSPDSQTLAVGTVPGKEGIPVRLYHVPTGVECGALHTPIARTAVTAVAFRSDGLLLATGHRDGQVSLWELRENPAWSALKGSGVDRFTFQERRTMAAHTLDVRALAFSPNGQWLASAGREGTATVWHVAEGEPLFQLTEHGRDVRWVAFSADNKLLATSGGDGTARLWQMDDGQEYAIYRAHKHSAIRAVFSPDGATLATCGSDKFIKIWKLQPPTRKADF